MAESSVALLECEQGDAAFRKLMSSPINAPRKRRRTTAKIAKHISTAGMPLAVACWPRSKPYVSPLSKPCPTYRQWLGSVMSPAEANREAVRANAEWSPISAHPFIAAVFTGTWAASPRTKRAVNAWIAAHAAPTPIVERKPSKRASRSSWPSYREQQIAGLIAAGEWEYLADCGHVEFIELAPIDLEPMRMAA
jgi:hypothetical protein